MAPAENKQEGSEKTMSVRFVIDSSSDFDIHEAEALGMAFLPMRVEWGGEQFRDQVDLDCRCFYERLIEREDLPTTCQITPFEYAEVFQQVTGAGDTAVVITLSSKLSGSCQSAVMAAEDFPGKVFVVDSLNATIGEQILIRYGLQLQQSGMEAAPLAEELDQVKTRIRLIAMVDTLEYLKRGGRVSAVAAAAGELLSIKPVIAVEDGEVRVIGKARGSRAGNNLLTQLLEKSGGVDFSMPYALGYSGLSQETLDKYVADSATLWQQHTDRLPRSAIGAVIGAHVGPGAIGAAFFQK